VNSLKAEIEIECKEPEIVLRSLEPELEDTRKFSIDLKASNNKLIITIESKSLSGLLAGINSYLRLVKVAKETLEI
jgi:tRNA threonylcarbamoyladenosine modification (KEOPS) complex  Pcc1 subunit